MKSIKLTRGLIAVVDDDDFKFLNQWRWHASSEKGDYPYAVRRVTTGNRHYVYMHRLVMKARKGKDVDHIDGDTLNNKKSNLRIGRHNLNLANRKMAKNNTSGFKGVYFRKDCSRWHAQCSIGTKNTYLGLFDTPEEAAEAYDRAAKMTFGDFARTNKKLRLL